jgi:hypothetical protein
MNIQKLIKKIESFNEEFNNAQKEIEEGNKKWEAFLITQNQPKETTLSEFMKIQTEINESLVLQSKIEEF